MNNRLPTRPSLPAGLESAATALSQPELRPVYTLDGPMPPLDLPDFPIRNTFKKNSPEQRKFYRRRKKWLSQKAQRDSQHSIPPLPTLKAEQFHGKPPCTHKENAQWAYKNLGLSDVKPEEAPSAAAYYLLQRSNRDSVFARMLIEQIGSWADEDRKKSNADDPEEIEIQREARKTDRELTEMIRKIARAAGHEPPIDDSDGCGANTG